MELLNIKTRTDFACYSAPANRQLANHAKTFLSKVNKAITKHNESGESDYLNSNVFDTFEKAMAAYIRSYNRACDTETGRLGGTGDTAVRESVWSQCLNIGLKLKYSEHNIDQIWESNYE